MRSYLLIISLLLLFALPSCRSHKATVIRPSANAEYRQTSARNSGKDKTKQDKSSKGTTCDGKLDVDPRVGSDLVAAVRHWLGSPYRYGGETKSGTDCSGMVMVVYRDVTGLKLPRSSAEQAAYCFNIPRVGLQPGDLVFFSLSRGGDRISHVGMYVGNGKIIHASTSRGVIESDLAEKYYDAHYHSSGRVYGVTLAATGGKASAKPEQSAAPAASGDAVQAAGSVVSAPAATSAVLAEPVVSSSSAKAHMPVKSNKAANSAATIEAIADVESAKSSTPTPVEAAAADVESDLSDRSDKSVEPAQVDGQSAQPSAAAKSAQPNVAPADSLRRADEIRRNVSKAMKFGK